MNKLDGKRILIWGYGREGKSTETFLKEHCHPAKVDIFEGKREEIAENQYDLIFKSPGIPMEEDSPKYTSQTEFFLQLFRKQVIGITGTKGKSTTATMIYHVLKECLDRPVLLVGNVGIPCLDCYDEITENTVIVFEMSCHQLSRVNVSPHIALFLNLFEEHLDYYGTVEKYFEAKKHITAFQDQDDFLLLGEDVKGIRTKASVITVRKEIETPFQLQILGEHNQYNAKFVYEVARTLFGIGDAEIRKSMETFTGLPHRLQFVGRVDGIDFYDDSISTIPEATIKAIESVKNTETVIIGGMDRNIDYSLLTDYVKAHGEYQYLFCYASGERIYRELSSLPNCRFVKEIGEAVTVAKKITEEGKACLLSPAAASYGYFKNFEERGDYFVKCLKKGLAPQY